MNLDWCRRRLSYLAEMFERKKVAAEPAAAPQASETLPVKIGRFSIAEPMSIEFEASPAEMADLLKQTAVTWRTLGEATPHWSVLAWDEFADPNVDEVRFYDTALHDIAVVKAYFRRAGFDIKDIKSMLELGCGVGRMTAVLAREVAHITAVDISEPHLAYAQRKLKSLGLNNVSFQRMSSIDDLSSLPSTDFFYSLIVLQHNPPPVITNLLSACLNKVVQGGFALFQVPTYIKHYNFTLRDYVPSDRMEMHPLPQMIIFDMLQRLGFVLIEVQEDACACTPDMASHTFFARRIFSPNAPAR
jgi:SAM-dependent methyltransferase